MKTRLAPGGSFQELCKRDHERNMFAWKFKNELDKSVFSEGKKEAKLKALGLIPAVRGDGAGKVIGVVPSAPTKTTNRGRPKGSKNGCKSSSPAGRKGTTAAGRKAARHGSGSPSAAARSKSRGVDDASKEPKERLMLQLFPIDGATRAALVAGGFNPHLELTFRAKKSVFGLMQHLASKWDKAVPHLPASVGEPRSRAVLQLYPFEAACASEAAGAWNAAHEGVTATDIFNACGRPAAFRVRYGWVPPRGGGDETPPSPAAPPGAPAIRPIAIAIRIRVAAGEPEPAKARRRGDGRGARREKRFVLPGTGPGRRVRRNLRRRARHGAEHLRLDLAGAALFGAPTDAARLAPRPDGDFTLGGFGDGDFSNMCREMGLDDPVAPRGAGMTTNAMAGASTAAGGTAGMTVANARAAKPMPAARAGVRPSRARATRGLARWRPRRPGSPRATPSVRSSPNSAAPARGPSPWAPCSRTTGSSPSRRCSATCPRARRRGRRARRGGGAHELSRGCSADQSPRR